MMNETRNTFTRTQAYAQAKWSTDTTMFKTVLWNRLGQVKVFHAINHHARAIKFASAH